MFRPWIDPQTVAAWFCPRDMWALEVTVDARVGGEYRFAMGPASWICGVYKEVSPLDSLSFTWTHVRRLDDGAERRSVESPVKVRFKDLGAATEVQLLHENLSGEAARAGVTHGWTGSFEKLRACLRPPTGRAGTQSLDSKGR